MTKNNLRLWFQSINQSKKMNLSNETISSTRLPEESDYSNYNGNTYFHLLSDEFYLICQNIPDKETRINLMVLSQLLISPGSIMKFGLGKSCTVR